METPLEDFARSLGICTVTDHSRCHAGTCRNYLVCPACESQTFVNAWHGRWDAERGRTALPFDPVAVTMGCGCVHGDIQAAEPVVTP